MIHFAFKKITLLRIKKKFAWMEWVQILLKPNVRAILAVTTVVALLRARVRTEMITRRWRNFWIHGMKKRK